VIGNAVTGNTWYDASGNIIKINAAGAGSIFNKSIYDGVGRVTARYVSYDTAETTYADAFNVTGDTVVQQAETAYDAASNVIQTTTHERLNDATGTGVLSTISGSQPKARVTNQVMYYDPISRSIAGADYGTNGDATLTRPASIPTSSATILVSKTAYDTVGMPYQTTDPRGLLTQTTFDQAGRKSSVAARTTERPITLTRRTIWLRRSRQSIPGPATRSRPTCTAARPLNPAWPAARCCAP
jgi:YD repeat-containing protein